MKRQICECLAGSVVCEACGVPCRWFMLPDGRRHRSHLEGHVRMDGSMRAIFRQHMPDMCRAAREATVLGLARAGLLREDSAR